MPQATSIQVGPEDDVEVDKLPASVSAAVGKKPIIPSTEVTPLSQELVPAADTPPNEKVDEGKSKAPKSSESKTPKTPKRESNALVQPKATPIPNGEGDDSD